MSRAVNLENVRFNKLTVLKRDGGNKNATWLCQCDCGNKTIVSTTHLKSGHTKSCGCVRIANISVVNKTHGRANKSRTYRSWKELRQRCLNPNSDKWKWYGQKGITVAPEWNNYEVFLRDMGERPANKTIDRINPNWGYYPENCRWATAKEQAETNRGVYVKRVASK